MICPRCGVTSKEEAEFCVSCGQPLKSSISSIPPTRNSRMPASEINASTVIIENAPSNISNGEKPEVSVRYRTISSSPHRSATNSDPVPAKVENLRETIVLNAPGRNAASTTKEKDPPFATTSKSPVSQPQTATETVNRPNALNVAALKRISASPAPIARHMPSSKSYKNTSGDIPPLDIQHIWYKITKATDWNTVVLVPVSDDVFTVDLARGFGQMAAREPCSFVRVVNASLVYAEHTKTNADSPVTSGAYEYFDIVKQIGEEADSVSVTQLTKELLSQFDKSKRDGTLKDGKIFVSIDPLISHPDGIALCRAVDKLILCVKLGSTQFDALNKTIEMVGRQKILGVSTFTAPQEKKKKK